MPSPRRWPRLPRPTARLRLTVLYGAAFLACGAAVLGLTYLFYGGTVHYYGVNIAPTFHRVIKAPAADVRRDGAASQGDELLHGPQRLRRFAGEFRVPVGTHQDADFGDGRIRRGAPMGGHRDQNRYGKQPPHKPRRQYPPATGTEPSDRKQGRRRALSSSVHCV